MDPEGLAVNRLEVGLAGSAGRAPGGGGGPEFSPQRLAERSLLEHVPGRDRIEMIEEDLVAERVAIDSYGGRIRFIGDTNPTTRRMLEGILAMEEEHADDPARLPATLGTKEKRPARKSGAAAARIRPVHRPGRAKRGHRSQFVRGLGLAGARSVC